MAAPQLQCTLPLEMVDSGTPCISMSFGAGMCALHVVQSCMQKCTICKHAEALGICAADTVTFYICMHECTLFWPF